jgi:hypothetical protein
LPARKGASAFSLDEEVKMIALNGILHELHAESLLRGPKRGEHEHSE